jgi:hypothetical protein
MTLRAIRSPLSALTLCLFFLLPLQAKSQDIPAAVADTALEAAAPDAAGTGLDLVPRVVRPLKRLACVPYARLRSGLSIFGDARLWWSRAKDLYERFAAPAVDAVMVFSGSRRIRRGHVAVVSRIVSPREIVIDHANWQNHGEIDLNTPVLDVSEDNDWSMVRVWNVATGQWGDHIYRVSGFIGREAPIADTAGS